MTVEVGGPVEGSPSGFVPYWSESVCYRDITSLRPGDTLRFVYGGLQRPP